MESAFFNTTFYKVIIPSHSSFAQPFRLLGKGNARVQSERRSQG
jgi:hypothetical protein